MRPSPMTTNWLTYGQIPLNVVSIIDGAMYFPPEVLKRSFLRSVILTNPRSSTEPMSPVWNQPSSESTSAVASGRLWYPRMTPGPLDEELAVVGRADLGPGQRPADGAEDVAPDRGRFTQVAADWSR